MFPALKRLNTASVITSLGIVSALVAMALGSKHLVPWACTAVWLSIAFDFFDGIVARRLKQTSEFGAELDSLADALSFLVAPAIVTWHMGFQGPVALIVLPLFVLSGLWRLANYNVSGLQESSKGTPTFEGLPTTNAACWWIITLAMVAQFSPSPATLNIVWGVFFATVAALMVSRLPVPKGGIYAAVHILVVPTAVALVWAGI